MTTVILNTTTRKVEVFSSARDVQARAEIAAHNAASDPHSQYLRETAAAAIATSGDAADLVTGTVPDARMPGWTGYTVAAKSALEAANVPSAVNAVRLLGYAAAGDGGVADYKRVGAEPAHAGKIQDIAGSWWEIASSELAPEMLGAAGDGVTNDTSAILNWLMAAAILDRPAKAGLPKTYLVDQISLSITSDLHIRSIRGAVIKGASGFSSTVVVIVGTTYRPSLFLEGLEIDNSLRTFVAGAGTGSALEVRNIDYFDIRNFVARGGADLTTSPVSGNGDSGIVINQCRWGVLYHPHMIGQPDLGIYVTGGPSQASEDDDRGDITIISPIITGCASALSSKRQGRRVTVLGGLVMNCRIGMSMFEASSIDPGLELVVIGTQFKRVTARALEQRGRGKLIARGVLIEDFGFNPVTNVADASLKYAILVQGGSYCSIDAHVRMRDWSGAGLYAIQMQQYTLVDSTVIEANNNRVTMQVEGVGTAVAEVNSATANHYDLVLDGGVTTPISLAAGSTSQWTYRDPSTGATYVSRSGAAVLGFNRRTSDGKIVEFHRDAVSKGAVSAQANDVLDLSSSGALSLSPSNTERVRLDTSGRLIVGHTQSVSAAGVGGGVQMHAPGVEAALGAYRWSSNGSLQAFMTLNKSRGASVGTRGAVADLDNLGDIWFTGDDGANFIRAAAIRGTVNGTPGTNAMPGMLLFLTTSSGGNVPAERFRLNASGAAYFPSVGTTASAGNAFLDSGSSPANQLLRSTSSLVYKRDIEPVETARAVAVLQVPGIWYRSKAQADNPEHSWYGFAAEDMAAVDPRLVHWGYHEEDMEDVLVGDGQHDSLQRRPKPGAERKPDGVMYDRIVVMHQEIIRDLMERVEALEAARPS